MMRIKVAVALALLSVLSVNVIGCVSPIIPTGSTAQTIAFSAPAAQTVGTPLTLVATASSGLTVSFASTTPAVCTVSGTTATFLTSGSCSITATQAGNSTYAAATPVSQSFTVNAAAPKSQTITFANPGAQTVGTPLTLAATASSGLTVSFASQTTSVCTISGTTATFLTAGTCTIQATQAGNSTYAAATPVTQSFTVNAAAPKSQTITFANPGAQTVGTPLTLAATASSGLTVSFASQTTSVCTISGTTATFLTAGTCTIQATQAGNSTYAAATPVSQSFTVNAAAPKSQTITFANPGAQTVGTPLTLVATASSGLTVSFASQTTSVCTVSGTSATFLTAGTCTIQATQAGNSTYAAASPVSQSFTVNAAAPKSQTITFANPGAQTVGTPLTLVATASSGLTVSFASQTTSVCTVSGTSATFLTAGTCTIQATQAGNSTYAAATPVSQSFTVNAAISGSSGLPSLPAMSNVQAEVSGNTVNITFDPVDGAQDYRAYVMPDDSDIVVSPTDGSLVGVKNAVYRCAGIRAVSPVNVDDDSPGQNNGYPGGGKNYSAILVLSNNYQPYGLTYTRTSADTTLGYVFSSPQPNTEPVYAVGDPAAASDMYSESYGGNRMKQTRSKIYLQDVTEYQAKVAAGWRDDGVVFYAPTNASACGGSTPSPVYEEESTDPGGPIVHRYYYTAAGEIAAWNQVSPDEISFADITSPTQPFAVCPAQVSNTLPLMRVHYQFMDAHNAHDELAVGQARYELARCQGTTSDSCSTVNHSLWSIRYSGITSPTQIVVEALDAGCPYPGALWGTAYYAGGPDTSDESTGGSLDPIYPLSQIQALSPIGEAYLNGQYDGNPTPHPIARAIVSVAPQTRPAMDFSSDFLNKPETFTEQFHADGTPDCGLDAVFPNGVQSVFPNSPEGCQTDHRLTSPTYDALLLSQDAFMGTIGMAEGELITTSANTQISPINGPQAVISPTDGADFLHVALETNGFTTDRRYPQITISDHESFEEMEWYEIEAPADTPSGAPFPDGDQENTLFLGSMMAASPIVELELCHNRGWQVNEHCPYFLLERSGNSLVNGEHTQSNNAHPDINDVMQQDTAIRWDLYVSKDKAYYYANSKAYGCVDTSPIVGITPGDSTPQIPTGDVYVAFGDRLYHPEAETGELCTVDSFLCKHSNLESIRRYDYFGYSNHQTVTLNSNGRFNSGADGTPAAWDEGVIPCNSVIFDTTQDAGVQNAEQ